MIWPRRSRMLRFLWVPVFGVLMILHILLHTRLTSWLPSLANNEINEITSSGIPKTQWNNPSGSKKRSLQLITPEDLKEKKIPGSRKGPNAHHTVPLSAREEKLEKESPSVESDANNDHLSFPLESHSTKRFVLPHVEAFKPKIYNDTTMDDPSIIKLTEQGMAISESQLSEIPSWSQITDIFGSEPVIIGLETCDAYRRAVPLENRTVAPAGLFNTGTNLFPIFFRKNCMGKLNQNILQVNWGKHNLADARLDSFTINRTHYLEFAPENILPVVMVRHPVSWMFSTCLHSYGAHWRHNQENCPHIVNRNRTDGQLVPLKAMYGYNRKGGKHTSYKSLIHLWKEWIHSYNTPDLPFPRLIIRLEDVVYRPDAVLKKICECAGGTQRNEKVTVPEESIKLKRDRWRQKEGKKGSLAHGKETAGLLKAWVNHASIAMLWQKIREQDKRVVRQVLLQEDEQDLLKTFHYKLEGI